MENSCKVNAAFLPVDVVSDDIAKNLEQRTVQDDQKPTRAKTRFLKFLPDNDSKTEEQIGEDVCDAKPPRHNVPLGRLVIVKGEGRGSSFALTSGVTRIGRADGQEVQLAFGDDFVSRDSHATITHYGKGHAFVIRDGMKANPVILNGRLLQGDGYLDNGDQIRIGATTLLFTEYRESKLS